ncbi:MAG: MliC family protein [Candidatus Kaistia colombiensis]|nr:MAG: MliC family protein [Kaistia sp.]
MTVPRHGLVLALGFAVAILASGADAADLTPVDAVAAESAAAEPAATAVASARSFEYQCEDGTKLTATFSPPEQAEGTADLVFADGKKVALPQAVSADGGRYTKDGIEFWIKGSGAMLTVAGKTTNCKTSE